MTDTDVLSLIKDVKHKREIADGTAAEEWLESLSGCAMLFKKNRKNIDVYGLLDRLPELFCDLPAPTEVGSVALCTNRKGVGSTHVQAVIQTARDLVSFGYRVVLVVTDGGIAAHAPDGVKTVVVPAAGEDYYTRIRLLEEVAVEHEVDAFILNSWLGFDKYWDLLALKGPISARVEKSIQVLLHFHGSFAGPQSSPGKQFWYYQAQAMDYFDGLITLSEVDRAFWEVFNTHTSARVLPIAGVLDRAQPASLEGTTIVHLFDPGWHKSQAEALHAFAHVLEQVDNAKLVLAGKVPNDWADERQALIDELGIGASVSLAGNLTADERASLLEGAALFLNTSLFEGYSLVLAEAKACGLPVASLEVPTATLLLGGEETGNVVVEQDDVAALGKAAASLLLDDEARCGLGKASWEYTRKLYDCDFAAYWKTVFSEYLQPKRPYDDAARQGVFRSIIVATHKAALGAGENEDADMH